MSRIADIAAALEGYDPQALSVGGVQAFLAQLVGPAVVAESEVVGVREALGRVLAEEEARNAGIVLNVVVELNSIHVMKKLVARGGLYSLASPSAVAAEVAAKELALSRIVSPEIRQTFHLVVGARRHASGAVF